MARKRKKRRLTPQSKIKKNKNEFLLGIIVFIAIIFVLFKVFALPEGPSKSQKPLNHPTPTTKPMQKQPVQEAIQNNDFKTVVIEKNDSYWKIAKRACGNAKLYWLIEAQNNSKSLFAGETVIANCQPT